jgi:hypothetical protein
LFVRNRVTETGKMALLDNPFQVGVTEVHIVVKRLRVSDSIRDDIASNALLVITERRHYVESLAVDAARRLVATMKRSFLIGLILCLSGCTTTAEVRVVDRREAAVGSRRIARIKLTKQFKVISSCMRKKGFAYVPFDPIEVGLVQVQDPPTLFTDPVVARKEGYGVFHETSGFIDPNEAYVRSLNNNERRAYQTALNGNEKRSGCMKETMGIGLISVTEAASAALTTANLAIANDARTRALVTTWGKCMRGKGFSQFKQPNEPKDWISHSVGSGQSNITKADERAVAKADADCTEPVFSDFEKIRKEVDEKYFPF